MDSEPFTWRNERDIPPRDPGTPSWQEQMLAAPELDRGEVAEFLHAIEDKDGPPGLPLFDLSALDGHPPHEREWILPGFIPEREVTLFTGSGGAGKSLFAQQLATCVAAQIPFLKLPTIVFPPDDGNAVLYVTCEDDETELHRRQRNIMAALRLGRRNVHGRLFLSSLRGQIGNELATFNHDGTLEKTETFHRLFRAIMRTGAQLVILDNVGHLFSGNENDRGQVTRFVNLLYSIVRSMGVTILLVAHPNKSGDSYSGSTAWLNAVRSQIDLSRLKDDYGNEDDPDARKLSLGKANYARHGQELRFRWHDFAFWHDDDLPADLRKEYDALALGNGENAAYLRCLAAATERKKAVSENSGTNYFAAVFAKMPEGKGYGKEAFKRAHERLLAIGAIELDAKLWQRENRTWKYGIRAVEKCTDQPHRPAAPTTTDQSAKPARTDHLISKDIAGAATQAAAPSDRDGEAAE
jgi:RecA-family ATPase